MDLLKLLDRSWPLLSRYSAATQPLLSRLMSLHTAVYRATSGRIGHTLSGLPTMLLLDHVGAKSKRRRTSPLLYFSNGDDLVLVASKGGHPRHPAWFHNLRAHPDTIVQVRDQIRPVRARVATQEERARLWPRAVTTYRPYETYQRRSGRKISLVILEHRP